MKAKSVLPLVRKLKNQSVHEVDDERPSTEIAKRRGSRHALAIREPLAAPRSATSRRSSGGTGT